MKYLIMLGNEEFLTAFEPEAEVQVLTDTSKEEALRFTSQDKALAMLARVRDFYNHDSGIRIVLDV